jgi:hypothetical protein
MDLLVSPSPELLEYVDRIQLDLSSGLDPRLLRDRTPAGREKDLGILRKVASRARSVSEFDHLDPQLQPSYAAVASPEAFQAQIDQLTRISTPHESILALHELIDVWNHVAAVAGPIIAGTEHKKRNVLLATSASRILSARTFLSPEGDVQIILFFERIFAFIEHVSYLLPLAIAEEGPEDDWVNSFPQLVIQQFRSFTADESFVPTVQSLLSRYRDGSLNRNRTWSHDFGLRRRLVAQDMASAMQTFVMAHELAHCLCEHKGTVLHWSFASEDAATALDVRELERSWDQEFEADYLGFRVGTAVSHRHRIPIELYCWSCYLLFYALSRCSPRRPSMKAASTVELLRRRDSHPPLADRQAWIEEITTTMELPPASTTSPITFEPIKALCHLLDQYP